MIVTRLRGGLGNQLFQVACGYALSHATGQTLAFDFNWYRKPARQPLAHDARRLLDALDIPVPPISPRTHAVLPNTRSSLARIARWPLVRCCFPARPLHRIEQRDTQPADLIPNPPAASVYLDGYWQRESFFPPHATDWTRMILQSPAPSIERRDNLPHVALHLRRRDYLHPDQCATFGVLSDDFYHHALASLQAEIGPLVAVVFSDDPALVQRSLQLHVPILYPDQQSLSSFHALRQMATCDHFIIANSTFSWWAAYLGSAPDKHVIAPDPWFRDHSTLTPPVLPADWLPHPARWLADDDCARLNATR